MEHLLNVINNWIENKFTLWTVIGLLGQSMFMMRFIFQWLHSERAKQSVVPEIFWYCSLIGGLIVLIYGIHQQEPVIILGQAPGVFIYLRNIHLIHKHKKKHATAE